MSDPKSWIVEATDDTFEREVFDRSQEVAVVVDFWGEWCPPCRMLGPILEEVTANQGGTVVLVKADTAQVPRWASQFGVQSIPAVFGVVNREVVGTFLGAQPKPQVESWVIQLVRHSRLVQAMAMEETDPAAAEQMYRDYLTHSPDFALALIGLGRTCLGQNREDEARRIVDQLEKRGVLEPEGQRLKSMLEVRSRNVGDLETLRAAVAAKPNDLSLRLQLADALSGSGEYQPALEELLAVVQQDQKQIRDDARQRMIDIFRCLGDDSDLAREYRRKLSAALY